MGEPVRIGSYYDSVEANLARARLEAEGIRARVLEPAAFNPLLNQAAGGIALEVSAGDAARAREVLGEAKAAHEEDEDEDVVRCPRCELQYCAFERPSVSSAGAVGMVTLVPALVTMLGPKRWRCHKCEHAWDDPKQGPKRITRLQPGDPRPVFLLRRTSAGMGLFVGWLLGMFVGATIGLPLGWLAFAVLAVGGWFIGRIQVRFVCSEPSCRKPLAPGSEECAACGGSVAGRVDRAAEHFSAAADFRREVAAARQAPYRDPPTKRKAIKANQAKARPRSPSA